MLKRKLLGDRAALASNTSRWPTPQLRLRAAAAAVALTVGAFGTGSAWAMSLGRVTVLSALGEPLRAEIDIPQITADEASNLKAGIPNPTAFKGAGMDYSTVLQGAQVTLNKRADGAYYLKVTSDKAVNEPFIDLIVEARWSSGQVVRDYTMLFDPPSSKQAAVNPVPAQVTQAPAATSIAALPRATPSTPPPAPAPAPAPTPAPSKAATPTPPPPPPPPPVAAAPKPPVAPTTTAAAPTGDKKQVKVQSGDTAMKIATANKPAELSLDQMLVALLRANPGAFIDGNINRLRSGTVLDIPSAEQASSLTAADARKTLSVQSANFNEYRKKLAETIPPAQVAGADRQASGSLQTKVEDKKPAAASPDKLQLTQSAVQGQSKPPEAKIAEERQQKEAAARAAEVSKNIKDLTALQAKAGGAPGAAASAAGKGLPGVPVGAPPGTAPPPASAPAAPAAPVASQTTAPGAPVAAAPVAVPPASALASAAVAPASAASVTASAPLAAASEPASAAASVASQPAIPVSKPQPTPAPVEEPSLVDDLLGMVEDPVVLGGIGGLLAALGGAAYYFLRVRKPRKPQPLDSSFIESRLQPDSFFGSSGGQHIDTNDSTNEIGGSSLSYSPSQLDAAGDVDPVAEADVYLAYGRDLQAEEILKEALRTSPARVAIHAKLLEIYAKRRDLRAFEAGAHEAHKLSGGQGTDWERICEFGRDLDPNNPLYQSSPTTSQSPVAAYAAEHNDPVGNAFGSSTLPPPVQSDFAPIADAAVDLDLDLDLGFDEPAAPAPAAPVAPPPPAPTRPPAPAPTPAPTAPPEPDPHEPLSFDLSLTPTPPAPPPAPAAPPLDLDMIEFDLSSLDFSAQAPAASTPASATGAGSDDGADDPMATKLELAQEFHAIGDTEGARALVEEVIAASSGPLKAKAQRFLTELS